MRRLARPLLGAFLALIGVLAPIESPDLPAPLDDLAGARPASAQTVWVEPGEPSPCPTTPGVYRPQPGDPDDGTASECVLEAPVCPETRLHDDQYMTLSEEYPNFCEEIIYEADDSVLYTTCTGERGLAVLIEGPSGSRTCRLVSPATCSAGMHRISSTTCRAVQRRTWTCDGELVPRNEFNSCYRQPPDHAGSTHPACGTGAPEFPILSCDEFVGRDFPIDPSTPRWNCEIFDTGGAPSAMEPQPLNPYWCRYDASLLDIDGHRGGAPSDEPRELCVKRASRTGGCDLIAHTMGCRSLQAALAKGDKSAEDVSGAGCEPCVILPFDPVPAGCPQSYVQEPTPPVYYEEFYNTVHRVKQDFNWRAGACQSVRNGGPMTADCAERTKCADPTRGHLRTTSHSLQIAVVNSPIILSVLDTPSTQDKFNKLTYVWRADSRPLREYSSQALLYPDDSFAVRVWHQIPSSKRADNVEELVSGGECVFELWPQFRVVIEELWPDNPDHYEEIKRLFGGDALDWWDALLTADHSTELQEAHTLTRGFGWWPELTTPEQQEQRTEELTQETACNVGVDVWCRWTPTRTGYYRLKAAGAWRSAHYDQRLFKDPDRDRDSYFVRLRAYLDKQDNRDKLKSDLQTLGLTPADLGLKDDYTNVLSRPPDEENWPYSNAATRNTQCPDPIDVRFLCVTQTTMANYTETEYIGIQVHEIRVRTVTPSR